MARETDIIALQLQKLLRPFENQSGIVGTNTGNNMINNIPLINTSDILNQYNVPGLQTSDVFNQEIKEQNLPNTTNTFNPGSLQSIFPTNVQTGITASSAAIPFKQDPIAIAQGFVEGSPSDASFPGTNFQFLPSASEADETDEVKQKSGIAKLFDFLQKFSPINIVRGLLPEQDPRAINIRNFYGSQFGLTPSGQVASGIMKGYNPISGGFINRITGGKYGTPTKYGLAGAMQRRIENILGRRIPQTDASRAKVKELRNLQLREMEDRADKGESLSSIGKTTFSGPGMAFEQKGGGYSVNKDTGEKRFYGGR